VAAGGGGIPVAMKDGQYRGQAAVIDKDFSAAKLAETLGADMLIILTAVEKVAINFGKSNQQWLGRLRTRARIKCHAFYSNCLYNKEIR
jgi:carbamate kinase